MAGLTLRVAPGARPGMIDIASDSPWGNSIGSISVPGHGDGQTWQDLSCEVRSAKGIHAVWLRFDGEGEDHFKVDWFQFHRH